MQKADQWFEKKYRDVSHRIKTQITNKKIQFDHKIGNRLKDWT